MSHFTVLVIGDDYHEQLAPFHEYECTGNKDEFVVEVDETEEYLKEYNAPEVNKETYPTFESYMKGYHELTDDCSYWGIRDGKVIRVTNPDAHWDWHQLGGRWRGFFKLKEGKRGQTGMAGVHDNDVPDDGIRADRARIGDIDFTGMARTAEAQARKEFKEMEKATKGLKLPIRWNDLWKAGGDNDLARQFYHSQPWVKACKELKTSFFGPPLEDYFGVYDEDPEGTFVQRQGIKSFMTFAVVKDRTWYEKGSMGWWGIVSDEKDEDEWTEQYFKLVRALPDDTVVSVVDCHI